MKYILGIVAGLMISTGVAAGDVMDQHMAAEAFYWLNGVPTDHQRYSALCGVFRQDADKRPIAVVYVKSSDEKKNEIVGEPVGDRAVVNVTSSDMDYVYGALAITRLCAEIPAVVSEATAKVIAGPDSGMTNRLLRNLVPDETATIAE